MCIRDSGHNDDFIVTKLTDIKIFVNAGSESSDHGFDLGIRVYFIKSCLLHIQNFTSQRKNGLCCTASGGLGGTTGGISLYDCLLYTSMLETAWESRWLPESLKKRLGRKKPNR